MNLLWVVILFVCILLIWLIYRYNTVLRLKENRAHLFSDMEVQLEERHHITEEIIETAKEDKLLEKNDLEILNKARLKAGKACEINERIKAEIKLTSALTLIENKTTIHTKPSLMLQRHQQDLKHLDEKIKISSRCFNRTTIELNSSLKKFPNTIVSKALGYKEEPLFYFGDKDPYKT